MRRERKPVIRKRTSHFTVLDRIKPGLPKVKAKEVHRDVQAAIKAVRNSRALFPLVEEYTDKRIREFLREDRFGPSVRAGVNSRLRESVHQRRRRKK